MKVNILVLGRVHRCQHKALVLPAMGWLATRLLRFLVAYWRRVDPPNLARWQVDSYTVNWMLPALACHLTKYPLCRGSTFICPPVKARELRGKPAGLAKGLPKCCILRNPHCPKPNPS